MTEQFTTAKKTRDQNLWDHSDSKINQILTWEYFFLLHHHIFIALSFLRFWGTNGVEATQKRLKDVREENESWKAEKKWPEAIQEKNTTGRVGNRSDRAVKPGTSRTATSQTSFDRSLRWRMSSTRCALRRHVRACGGSDVHVVGVYKFVWAFSILWCKFVWAFSIL